ncbi:hypothetical protein Aph02nite_30140 [Actinoplanes philippinensis]|uniref:DUF4253 domain-containing protein n=1 Tax=Actinoplanes philippinensis TaxID=35752 RepID=A0A1I2EFM9_9ACTN|nr:DUF4253 domain-containing protein [Actinoplanes philippinensis]GIE77064.1 hypothetical protein Aph02nite_30140 [Actinoplanes philippinensis]SFE91060.1 protein of unknown function [Actinoplanes philippinensis]
MTLFAMPATERLAVTPSGAEVTGFTVGSDTALDWWHRLRAAYPETGLWPLLIDDDAPGYLEDPYTHATVEESLTQAYALDGAAILAGSDGPSPTCHDQVSAAEIPTEPADRPSPARHDQSSAAEIPTEPADRPSPTCHDRASAAEIPTEPADRPSPARHDQSSAAEIPTEPADDGEWPGDPERPGLWLPYDGNGRPLPITVALVPAAEPWLVPVTLHYGGWNGYPDPGEHAAIMRHFLDEYGAEPVFWSGANLDYLVARPPTTRPEAVALAWKYRRYNDGEYDFYRAETLTGLAAALLNNPVWRMWWD